MVMSVSSNRSSAAAAGSSWVCPSDRHLTLRAKLNSGWSSRSSSSPPHSKMSQKKINSYEINRIQQVLRRANVINNTEKLRIGAMVDRVELETQKISGSGGEDCLSCAQQFGKFIFGYQPIFCVLCNKKFCLKCCVDFTTTLIQQVNDADVKKKICRICCEKRELWKRSGAWFYHGLPPLLTMKYTRQENLDPIHDLPPEKPHPRKTLRSFISISSSSDFSGSETSSSSRHTSIHKKKTPRNWKRKIEVPLIKRLKHKVDLNYKQKSGDESKKAKQSTIDDHKTSGRLQTLPEYDDNLLKVQESKLHMSVSSLESSFDSDYEMMYYDNDCGGSVSNISVTSETSSSKNRHKKGKFGHLVFSLLYDEEKAVLQVKVIKAKKLKAKDMIGSSDPYVKVHLLPGNKRSTKQRTKTVRRNLNPTFNETLIYSGIPKRDVERKRIQLTVKDHDRIGSDDFLGEVEVALNQLESGRPKYFDMELQRHKHQTAPVLENEEDTRERGRALISLQYDPTQQVLLVRVPICTGLVTSKRRHHINAQVQAVLSVIGDTHVPKQTTCAKTERRKGGRKAASNLVFAQCMRLFLPSSSCSDLSKCNLDVAVWDRDTFGRETLIGAIHFSSDRSATRREQLHQWCNCCEIPQQVQECWHHVLAVEDEQLVALLHENKK